MLDDTINSIRSLGGESLDNHQIAGLIWLVLATVLTFGLWNFAIPSSQATTNVEAYAFIQDLAGIALAAVLALIVLLDFTWPVRKIESWLNSRYPEQAVDWEYSLKDDLHSTFVVGGYWGLKLGIAYVFITFTLWQVSVFDAISSAGFPLSTSEVTQLTVINSMAIGIIGIGLACALMLLALNYYAKDAVERVQRRQAGLLTENSTSDRRAVADGGDVDGS